MISENIKSRKRVRRFGEVFTPDWLVNEMLDTLPEEVWKNPNLKWLDNSCGTGNFLVEIQKRLRKYHGESQLKNMIYGVDIQSDNVITTKERLGEGYSVACFDALEFDYWDMKFDVIVGNPPYNKDKGNKKGNTCNPLWPDFVNKSIDYLADSGYLLLIHPPLWRKPDHKIFKLFSDYQLLHIKMFGIEEGMKIFNCGTKVDYYCLQKTKPTKNTIIIDETGKSYSIDVSKHHFIPNHSIDEVYSVFGNIKSSGVIYGCQYHHYSSKLVNENKTNEYRHPCVYLANKKGVIYYYAKSTPVHFGVPKVIIPMGSFVPILDSNGEYGMCEVTFAIPISSATEGKEIMRAFDTEKFNNILSACKWKTFQLDWRLFKYLNGDFYKSI